MFKRIIITFLAIFFIFSFVSVGMAGDKGNKRKGKHLYRKVYKSCYDRGAVSSKKPLINPDSKTQAQWNTVFENKDFEQFGCKEEWDQLSEKDLLDIFTYLHSGAYDSPSPAKCQ